MEDYGREDRIRSIIKMEERIGKCGRCPELVHCTYKPSLGRGDLEPQVMLVFESESSCTRNMDWIIQTRNSIKQHFAVARVYHTYLVRCQPKACPGTQGIDCSVSNRLLDRYNRCLLTSQECAGIPIKPTNGEILNCLTYLLEEITVLQPGYVMLLGRRVSDFVLKTFGIWAVDSQQSSYVCQDITFIPAPEAETLRDEAIRELAASLR